MRERALNEREAQDGEQTEHNTNPTDSATAV